MAEKSPLDVFAGTSEADITAREARQAEKRTKREADDVRLMGRMTEEDREEYGKLKSEVGNLSSLEIISKGLGGQMQRLIELSSKYSN